MKPQKVKQSEKAQIEKLWQEAEGKGKMKQSLGFGGSGIWAIVFLLVVGVIWIRNDYGKEWAGAAVLAVFGVAVFLLGQLVNIGSRQTEGNIRINEKQAEAQVERERIKGENIVAKFEAQQQMKMFVALLSLFMKTVRQTPKPQSEDQTIELQEQDDVWI